MTASPIASRVGSRGGANDYFVRVTLAELEMLHNAPAIDEAAIQAAMERLRVAIERRNLVMRMKARGGSITGNDHH